MKIEILGSGGSFTIPRPACRCRVCAEARSKGTPYSRSGPSVFIHGPNILIDTPEESKEQLNRAGITKIDRCIYSHWHGDHVMGRRVWWSLNYDFKHVHPKHRKTPIYIPQQVAQDFKKYLGTWQQLNDLAEQGMVQLSIIEDGDTIKHNDMEICPFRLAEDYVYGFLVTEKGKRAVIIMDDMFEWNPPDSMIGVDLAILPMGVAEFNPLTGRRRMGKNHPVLAGEATFDDTLKVVKRLQAKETVLSHIEEHDGMSYNDLEEVSNQLQADGNNIRFAFDSMQLNV